jgi:hypothetical protein
VHKKVQEMMNAYEKAHPHHRNLNDLAIEDLHSLGDLSPAKPFAMHVGYTLDGHHKNREHYGKNYDHGLPTEEKKIIDKELFDLAELGAMLHDPEYIADDSHETTTENHRTAKDVLEHFMKNDGQDDAHGGLMEALYRPLLHALLDRSIEKEGILHDLLAPTMVKDTEHSKEAYSDLLKALLLWPVIEGHRKGNWKKKLPKIFEDRGKRNA